MRGCIYFAKLQVITVACLLEVWHFVRISHSFNIIKNSAREHIKTSQSIFSGLLARACGASIYWRLFANIKTCD
jgi:hypothetical protein